MLKPEYRRTIEEKTNKRLGTYLHDRRENVQDSKSLKHSMEQIVSMDYRGRTVIELIQNAYDAHPLSTTDGRIALVLDVGEGDHGVLYVANAGLPLGEKNFHALVDLALSDKKASAGIGHKGVGFKSVLQVTGCPEVYSKSTPSAEVFDGFSFRFGMPADFVDLAARAVEEVSVKELEENISPLMLTYAQSTVPSGVQRIVGEFPDEDGYATVVRLPLKNEGALHDVLGQLEEVVEGVVPTHLFLDRVSSLSIALRAEGHGDLALDWIPALDDKAGIYETVLTKQVVDLPRGIEKVVLQDGRQYLVARRRISEERMEDAIKLTQQSSQLADGWSGWEGAGEVSVALPLSGPPVRGRFFAFLPMGEDSRSPFPGHVNAPFVTSMDRRALDLSVHLNDFLLDQVADLVADLFSRGVDGEVGLSGEQMVDLASWAGGENQRFSSALERHGRKLANMRFLPTVVSDDVRTSPHDGLYWGSKNKHFSQVNLDKESRVDLVSEAMGPVRTANVKKIFDSIYVPRSWAVGKRLLAEYAEQCASELYDRRASVEEWKEFYSELAASDLMDNLVGRKIILGKSSLLRAHEKGTGRKVFYSPQKADEFPDLPQAVARNMAFVHPELRWERTNAPSKHFLDQWVTAFRTAEVISSAVQASQAEDLDDAVRMQVLRYVYEVWKNMEGSEKSELLGKLRIPTSGGWNDAEQAFFGAGWWEGKRKDQPLTADVDRTLAELVAEVKEVSNLNGMAERLLVPWEQWQRDGAWSEGEEVESVRKFLEAAGVTHGLKPINALERTLELRSKGYYFQSPIDWIGTSGLFQREFETAAKDWAENIHDPDQRAQYREDYILKEFHFLPGQTNWERFSYRAREQYAALVMRWLSEQQPQHYDPQPYLDVLFRRPYGWANVDITWDSPIAVFLKTKRWVPVRPASSKELPEWVAAPQVWWPPEGNPQYLPVPLWAAYRLGRRAGSMLKHLGARFWSDPDSATERLDFLADNLERLGWSRSVQEPYTEAWDALLSEAAGSTEIQLPRRLVVREEGKVRSILLTSEDTSETVYYPSVENPNSILLEQLPNPIIAIPDRHVAEKVGEHLHSHLGTRFRSVDDSEIEVTPRSVLHEGCLGGLWPDWIVIVTLLVHREMSGPSDREGEDTDHILQTLGQTRLVVCEDFSAVFEGEAVKLPEVQTSVSAADCDGMPAVYVRSDIVPPSPAALTALAAEGISQAIGYPFYRDRLRTAFTDIDRLLGNRDPKGIDAGVVGAALRVPEELVLLVKRDVYGQEEPEIATHIESGVREAFEPAGGSLVPPTRDAQPPQDDEVAVESVAGEDTATSEEHTIKEAADTAREDKSAEDYEETGPSLGYTSQTSPSQTRSSDRTGRESASVAEGSMPRTPRPPADLRDFQRKLAAKNLKSPTYTRGHRAKPRRPRTTTTFGSFGSRAGGTRLKDPVEEQAVMAREVGLYGEVAAAEWIKQTYGISQEETWKSGYRNDELGDGLGVDGLGYDFEVPTDDGVLLIEVKSTETEQTVFHLTAREVEVAKNHAGDGVYKVLVIRKLHDPDGPVFHLLDNPEGEGRSSVTRAESVTYSFELAK